MAILSNINDKFAVDSTGAIQFNGQAGTSGYVLKSNGNAAPTWVDASTVIGGPYLPLSGGTLTGATATASGISFTVGGTLTGTTADFTASSSDVAFFRSSQATTTNLYITNTNATTNNTANLYFAPANNIAGSYIKSTAIEDFSTSANRTSDLRFGVRKDGTFNEAVIIDSTGAVLIGGQAKLDTATRLQVSGNSSGVTSFSGNADDIIIEHNANVGITLASPNTTSQTVAFADPESPNAGFFLYDHSVDALRIGTNTSERMRIDSSGNVGIGTTSPSTRLTVKDSQDSSFDSGIGVIRSANSQTGYINMVGGAFNFNAPSGVPIRFRDGGTVNVTIDGSGNVGIGATSPSQKLEVRDGDITTRDASNTNYAQLSRYTGLILKGNGAGSRGIKTPNTDALTLGTNNIERIRIDSSGLIRFIVDSGTASAIDIGYVSSARTIRAVETGGGNARPLTLLAQDFTFKDDTATRMTIDSSGRVGIGGPPLATARLSTRGLTNTSSDFSFEAANSSGNSLFIVRSDGNVGIGTASPVQPLDVNGYAQVDKLIQRDNSTTVNLTTPRVLNIGYRGANGTYTFDPVSLFGSAPQGGQCTLEVTGWRAALNNGIIHWADNGSNTNIGAGNVYYTQTAYRAGGQTGNNLISVSNNSGTNNITITFTGWHSNSHGWNCKIISYQA